MPINWIKFLGLVGLSCCAYAASSPPNKRQRLFPPRDNSLRRFLEGVEEIPIKRHILIQNYIPTELYGNSIDFSLGEHQVSLKINPKTSIVTHGDFPQGKSFF